MTMWVVLALAIVLPLLLGAWLCRSMWLAVSGWEFRRDAAQCPRCGYPVEGLPTWTCPECGSNLLEVGILGSKQDLTKRRVLLEAIKAWAIVAVFIALVIANSIESDHTSTRFVVVAFSVWAGITLIGAGLMAIVRRINIKRKRAREAAQRTSRKPAPPPPITAPNESAP